MKLSLNYIVHMDVPGNTLTSHGSPPSLCDLSLRQKARIQAVKARGSLKKRLLDMGFVRGEEIQLDKVAPLGDPLDFVIKGYHISLRREEAERVFIYFDRTPAGEDA
jgi:Fe2+ transport system protein FeoA